MKSMIITSKIMKCYSNRDRLVNKPAYPRPEINQLIQYDNRADNFERNKGIE